MPGRSSSPIRRNRAFPQSSALPRPSSLLTSLAHTSRHSAGVAGGGVLPWIDCVARALRSVRASTIWHVNVGNTGACTVADPNCASIKAAVEVASDGDTINVTSGTYLEHDIIVNKSLTIQGVNQSKPIIDAQQQGRVFNVPNGANVTLTNLKLTGGKAPDGLTPSCCASPTTPILLGTDGEHGGAILNEGTLTLNNSTIDNNEAGKGGTGRSIFPSSTGNGAGGSGGGIYNTGTLTINDSTISNNRAGNGGGLPEGSAPTTGGAGGAGGGLFNSSGGVLNVSQSTITNNESGAGGIVPAQTSNVPGSGGAGGASGTPAHC
jgi:hypothetical protein